MELLLELQAHHRAAPLVRVKVKITVKNAGCKESSATVYGVLTVNLTFARTRRAALTPALCPAAWAYLAYCSAPGNVDGSSVFLVAGLRTAFPFRCLHSPLHQGSFANQRPFTHPLTKVPSPRLLHPPESLHSPFDQGPFTKVASPL